MLFETIIGLEIHVELKTKSKIFCTCSTKYGAKPNENTCPVCMGIPGTLPVLNEEVINLAAKAGIMMNCDINKLSKMDRKNYFYPDLPKAYQISQYDIPICRGGYVDIDTDGICKRINLNRIHIEEDAGKLIHPLGEIYSLVDYNRAGVPLIEIVTEPDLRSVDEAIIFLKELKSILQYGEISECRMEQGSLRCDANISLRQFGQKNFNTRVELKNLNSFKELQKALNREESRQRELYSIGESYKIVQETRRWDSIKGETVSMRSKEDAHDYRYFPEPDLVPLFIGPAKLQVIREAVPELPCERKKRFKAVYGLSDKEIDIIIGDKTLSDYYEALVSKGASPKTAANWLLGSMLKLLNENKIEIGQIPVAPESLYKLITLIAERRISITAGQEVLKEMFHSGMDAEEVVISKGLTQLSDPEALEVLIDAVLNNNPESIADYKSGKMQAVSFLMGQIMKASKGRANPQLARELLDIRLQK